MTSKKKKLKQEKCANSNKMETMLLFCCDVNFYIFFFQFVFCSGCDCVRNDEYENAI